MVNDLNQLQARRRELIQLHAELTEDLMDIKGQLKEFEESGTVRGRPVDDQGWVIRARDARKHTVAHLNQVQKEIGEVKGQIADWHLKKSLPHAFHRAASEYLPREVFAKITDIANKELNYSAN